MKTLRAKIHIECPYEAERPYLQAVANFVLQRYDGKGPQWQWEASPNLWPLSLGGRAGVVGVKIDNRVCCVKLFYDRRWTTYLRTFFGYAKAKTAYRHALRLRRYGVTCPIPLGYAERRPIGPALVVTELIADGLRLDRWIEVHGVTRPLVVTLARFLRHMHDRGISHVDLSPRNLLIQPGDTAPMPTLLDYEDARFHPRLTRAARLNNLHHLDERLLQTVTLRERLRFLRVYAGADYRAFRQALGRMIDRSRSKYVETYRRESGDR